MRKIYIAVFLVIALGGVIFNIDNVRVFARFATDNSPIVSISDGRLRGMNQEGVVAFKGIPFAQPPVGVLRWRAPQPVKPWDGVLDAVAMKPDPPQENATLKTSEDCLYLNVYKPAVKTGKPLPVLVWIYGGSLAYGGASIYPGERLAKQGIIVVTFNYRVGRLGFFAHPALTKEMSGELRGNYGYMDQIAALQWVKKNIAAFGGDPSNVTIAGESAGGGSVLVLMTSPMARGLFNKAILESPAIPGPRAEATPMRSLSDAESIAVDYARRRGIDGDGAASLAALRAIPADTLAQGTQGAISAIFGGPQLPGIAHCIIDGRLVIDAPQMILRAGRQAMVPVLVGANDHDLAYTTAQTKDELFAQFGHLEAQARKQYDPAGNKTLKELTQEVIADKAMVEPSRHLAEEMTRAGQPAYFYRFSYVAESERNTVPGAAHAGELIYVLDIPGYLKHATKSDADMARVVSNYWVSFIKTGDPNSGGAAVKWPVYDRETKQALNFTNQGVVYGFDPIKSRLDLWQSYWGAAMIAVRRGRAHNLRSTPGNAIERVTVKR
jgi:para-nitrobenzyl esterase